MQELYLLEVRANKLFHVLDLLRKWNIVEISEPSIPTDACAVEEISTEVVSFEQDQCDDNRADTIGEI